MAILVETCMKRTPSYFHLQSRFHIFPFCRHGQVEEGILSKLSKVYFGWNLVPDLCRHELWSGKAQKSIFFAKSMVRSFINHPTDLWPSIETERNKSVLNTFFSHTLEKEANTLSCQKIGIYSFPFFRWLPLAIPSSIYVYWPLSRGSTKVEISLSIRRTRSSIPMP